MATPAKVRLFFHIGAGKTGTSSIQATLKHAQPRLLERGVWYLGMLLENANLQKFPWQAPTTDNHAFHSMAPDVKEAQLTEVLAAVVEHARASGIHTLVWSNESFFNKIASLADMLSRLERSLQIDIVVVAYVRSHDSWLKSGYVQWGVKHKTYKGRRVMGFGEWAQGNLPKMAEQLNVVNARLGSPAVVHNYNALKDVVPDFLKICGIPAAVIEPKRANDSVTPPEMYLRALFNTHFNEQIRPPTFNKYLNHAIKDSEVSPQQYINALYPSEDVVRSLVEQCRADFEATNQLLELNGQPPMQLGTAVIQPPVIDSGLLLAYLSSIVVSQAVQMQKMAKDIQQLKEQLAGPAASQ